MAAAPEPRVRVIAGPGTGKSFAMKRRVAKLLESGIAPKEVLAVTFTRVAAEDLRRELQKLGFQDVKSLRDRPSAASPCASYPGSTFWTPSAAYPGRLTSSRPRR
jgi:superfamily I DNA/RNA helicase